jgi:conjugal transfer pilus assembly protein TraK
MQAIEPPIAKHGQPARLLCALALACMAGHALALQVVDASDGASVEAIVSIQEPTRIRIEGSPITDVFGSVYSSGCASLPAPPAMGAGISPVAGALPQGATSSSQPVNPAGEIVLECDRDKGEIYVRPVGESKKPINLFVSSAGATYTLVLRRADTPADTIVIRDKAALQRRAQTQSARSAPGVAASHVRSLKALLVAMASGHVPSDFQTDAVGQTVPLWREARFTLERTYRGRGLIGERYTLRNVSDEPMVLTEPEFDRADDESGSVSGIAIEHHNLLAGESTQVFVIREEAQP